MDSNFTRQPISPPPRQPFGSSPAPATTPPPAPSVPPAAPLSSAPATPAPAPTIGAATVPSNRNVIGRVLAVSGAQVTVGLSPGSTALESAKATVGKFLGILSTGSVIVGMITEIAERPPKDRDDACRSVARLDLVGEIKTKAGSATAQFQRGVTEYPIIGEPAMLMTDRELRVIYSDGTERGAPIGVLQQDHSISAQIDITNLVSKHFAVLGTTGAGKSCAVTVILRAILDAHPFGHVIMLDPHNEYAAAFGSRAELLNPGNLKLPYWLLNFEETAAILVNHESPESAYAEGAILRRAILRARRSRSRNCSSANGAFSAVPWISMMRPSLVSTKFASASAALSSA